VHGADRDEAADERDSLRLEFVPETSGPRVESWRLFAPGDSDEHHVYPEAAGRDRRGNVNQLLAMTQIPNRVTNEQQRWISLFRVDSRLRRVVWAEAGNSDGGFRDCRGVFHSRSVTACA